MTTEEPREAIDVLIANGCVITLDLRRRVIENGAVAVKGERIVAVGDTEALQARYRAARTIFAPQGRAAGPDRRARTCGIRA
ncbi:hypothetical protein WJ63_27030 [Burkholderia pyrrocinia]|nr:hypothetical protein WJ63_27030 [Burkholderia pyrrocinia]